jgi:hypothetical protein
VVAAVDFENSGGCQMPFHTERNKDGTYTTYSEQEWRERNRGGGLVLGLLIAGYALVKVAEWIYEWIQRTWNEAIAIAASYGTAAAKWLSSVGMSGLSNYVPGGKTILIIALVLVPLLSLWILGFVLAAMTGRLPELISQIKGTESTQDAEGNDADGTQDEDTEEPEERDEADDTALTEDAANRNEASGAEQDNEVEIGTGQAVAGPILFVLWLLGLWLGWWPALEPSWKQWLLGAALFLGPLTLPAFLKGIFSGVSGK